MSLNPRLRELEKRVSQAEKAAPDEDIGEQIDTAIQEARLILFAVNGNHEATDAEGAADFGCSLAACSGPVGRVVRELMGKHGFSPADRKELRERLPMLSATDVKTIDEYNRRANGRDTARRNLARARRAAPVEMGTPMDRRGL